MNFIKFQIKPNIKIVIFSGIQIARHHILWNTNAGSNIDSPKSNAIESFKSFATNNLLLRYKFSGLNFISPLTKIPT